MPRLEGEPVAPLTAVGLCYLPGNDDGAPTETCQVRLAARLPWLYEQSKQSGGYGSA
jgi:hypothetical protein